MFDELRKMIENAFPVEPAISYRLSQAIIDDDHGDEAFAFEEKWRYWNEIEDWQVAKCYVLFTYAPRKASEYLLPRYMIFYLDQIEDKVPDSAYEMASDMSGFRAKSYIEELKRNDYQDSSFTEEQICVLEIFLASVHEF